MTSADLEARRTHIEGAIRGYFDGCNAADAEAMRSYFTPDAVHYFPEGSSFGAFRCADAIAQGWVECVRQWDSRWTIDRMLIDAAANEAVIEWTHFQPGRGLYLRGDEWYIFDEAGLITEIRAYYACPIGREAERHELGEYPYHEHGYPMGPPDVPRRSVALAAMSTWWRRRS